MGPVRKLIGTCLATAVWVLVAAGITGASTTHDLRGTWSCCGAGGAAPQTWKITRMSLSTGKFSGSGSGNGYTFPITGTATAGRITGVTGPYQQLPSYSGTFTGHVSANGKTMSGSWKSNQHQSGTWTATRTSGPPPKGKATCRVPKLTGDTLAAARRALRRAHCAAGKITRKKSVRVGKGRVVSSIPAAGSKHKPGTRINLTLSLGKH